MLGFNEDALNNYVDWVATIHKDKLTFVDVPPLPPVVGMLAGAVNIMVRNEKGLMWPVIVKKVWQSEFSAPKSIEEIIAERKNFYMEQDGNGQWQLKPNTAVYYACQNVCMVHNMKGLDLVLFSEHNRSMLVINVAADKNAFKANVAALEDFLKKC